jgi:C-terminal processing protease CtpA/Prc
MQTNHSYDVAIARGHEGIGLSVVKDGRLPSPPSSTLHSLGEDVLVGSFLSCPSDGSVGPAESTQLIQVGDKLIAVNKESISHLAFPQKVNLLTSGPSPLLLTFRRQVPLHLKL